MTSLEKRKMEVEKEMREIEELERQAAIREQVADQKKSVDRLLLDLIDQPLACGLPIRTVSHVKRSYSPKDDDCQRCFFNDTCSSILSLTGKGKGKSGRRSSNKKRSFNNNKLNKDFSQNDKGIFQFTVKGETYKIFYNDFYTFKLGLKYVMPFKDCEKAGLTKGQWQGLTHRKTMLKKLAITK